MFDISPQLDCGGRLLRLDVQDTPVIREWNVLVHAERPMTPALEALLDFLQADGAAMMRARTV